MNFSQFLTVSLCFPVVSVKKLGFSAVDLRASPGLSTDCVTQADPLGQSLNSTRNPLANWTSALVLHQQLWDLWILYIFGQLFSQKITEYFWPMMVTWNFVQEFVESKYCIMSRCPLTVEQDMTWISSKRPAPLRKSDQIRSLPTVLILHYREFMCLWTRTETLHKTECSCLCFKSGCLNFIQYLLDTKLPSNKLYWPKGPDYRSQISTNLTCCYTDCFF